MTTFVRQHKGAVLVSVVLHVAVAAVLTLNLRLPSWRQPIATMVPIEGVIIDQAVLEREQERREEAQRQERQRLLREERQKRAVEDAAKRAVEQRQRDEAAAVRREQDKAAAEKARAEQVERDKAAAAKREQERIAEETRKREAEEQKARAEADKRARELRARQQAENELQEALRADQARTAAALDQYIAAITNDIEKSWIPPASVKAGLNCLVNVVQIPSGDVIDVRVAPGCNGDEAVVRSIEVAVRKASPLPLPRDPALFERNLNVTFRPNL